MLFKNIYQEAKALGIKRTAHAGEEGPASFIRDAIDGLRVDRIDHGIRLRDDPELLKRLASEGTLLTVVSGLIVGAYQLLIPYRETVSIQQRAFAMCPFDRGAAHTSLS